MVQNTGPFPAITGVTDASNVRVALVQGTQIVSAPALSIGLQPLDADLTAIAALTPSLGNIIVGNGTTWVASQQAYELISKGTAASVATVDFTGLSAFRTLRLSGKMAPATNAVNFGIRTSTNNGSSYDSGAADYTVQAANVTGATFTGAVFAGDTFFLTSSGVVGNAAQRAISFVVDILDFNQADYAYLHSQAFFLSDAGSAYRVWNGGFRGQTTARNALRILFSSGNISGGYYTLEGIRG